MITLQQNAAQGALDGIDRLVHAPTSFGVRKPLSKWQFFQSSNVFV